MKHIESHVKELGLVGIVFTCIYFQIWYLWTSLFFGFAVSTSWCRISQESGPSNCHQTSRRLGTFSKWNKSRDFWRSVSADVPVVSWSKSFISACTTDALWFYFPKQINASWFQPEHPINNPQYTYIILNKCICCEGQWKWSIWGNFLCQGTHQKYKDAWRVRNGQPRGCRPTPVGLIPFQSMWLADWWWQGSNILAASPCCEIPFHGRLHRGRVTHSAGTLRGWSACTTNCIPSAWESDWALPQRSIV